MLQNIIVLQAFSHFWHRVASSSPHYLFATTFSNIYWHQVATCCLYYFFITSNVTPRLGSLGSLPLH